MKKVISGILVLAMLAMLATLVVPIVVAQQNEVYLDPEDSSAHYCSEKEVEIWANTIDTFGYGQINLTYTHCCANVTGFVYNNLMWQGTWDSSVDGKEWLVFTRPLGQLPVSGTVLIGTLTIHCCDTSKCTTPLTFSLPSKLSDPAAGKLEVNWKDGTFNCTIHDITKPSVTNPTATPTSIKPDGIETSELRVTVTDDVAVESVTVNLSALGGEEAQPMSLIWGDEYRVPTTAAVDTAPGDYELQVNATDTSGNYNNTVNITLNVTLELQYTLTISSTHGGNVTVPGEGTFTRAEDEVVNLKAVPDSGYKFVNWTGDVGTIADDDANETTITMDDNYTIKAEFEPIIPYTLAIDSSTGGSVTVPGEGTFTRAEDEVVNLTAVADSGYKFDKWTGDVGEIGDDDAEETTITMKADYTIKAEFERTIRYGGGAGRVRATPTPTPIATPTPGPTPTPPVVKPTPTPTIPPAATATPGPTPTPTPTEPGFEAVFAIAGLLAVAYLVLRRKRK